MDFHFPWNASKRSLKSWFSAFFTVHNLLEIWREK
ncbi:MAG: IS6 family transposase, partial [Metallosphaera sp.]